MSVEGCGVKWNETAMVVVDENVITGRGPAADCEFGLTIVSQSLGADAAKQVAEGMLIV